MSIYIDLYRPKISRSVLAYQTNNYIYNSNPNQLQHLDIYYATDTKLVKLIPDLLLIK